MVFSIHRDPLGVIGRLFLRRHRHSGALPHGTISLSNLVVALTGQGPNIGYGGACAQWGLDMTTYLIGRDICRSAQLYGQGHIVGHGACKNVGRLKIGDVLLAEV